MAQSKNNSSPKKSVSSRTHKKRTNKKTPLYRRGFLSRFSRPVLFMLAFAAVGLIALVIVNAATKTFSYSGRLTDTGNVKTFAVTADNTGNLTSSLTWDRKTTVRLKITSANGTVAFDKTSSTSPLNAAIPVSKGSYTFTVSKVDGWNTNFKLSGTVNTVDPRDTTPPSGPTNLQATLTNPNTATLTWTVSTDDVGVANYKIYRNGVQIASTPNNGYTNGDLAPATLFEYTVTAYDAAGNPSVSSNTASVTTPTTGTPPPSTSDLTWAPPTGWQNYTVKNVTSATSLTTIDGGGGNVLIKLPTTSAVGPITIQNCANAVLIGGQINLLGSAKVNNADQRAIYIKNCTGIVHIEGVYINGDRAGAEGDGIAIDADFAIVQVQNVRIHKLYGGEDKAIHNHSDIIQPWGGVKELRVDRLSGTSNYQGLQINSDLGPIGTVTIKNTNVGDSGVAPPTSAGGYYVWLKCASGTKYTFTNAFVKPRGSFTLDRTIWDGSYCNMVVNGNVASFTHSDITSGSSWTKGDPPNGDFVPAGSVGLNYQHKW